jgi:AcrR family transcriptional regulator
VARAARTQLERTEASSRALLDAAAELIAESGIDALTLAAIGERAGYSRGLVTMRFGTKDGLIEALIDRIAFGWQTRTLPRMVESHNGLEGALRLVEGIWRQIRRDPAHIQVLYRLFFEAIGDSGDNAVLHRKVTELHRLQHDALVASLRRGVEDGSVRAGVDVDLEADLVTASLRGIGYLWLLDPRRIRPVPLLQELHARSLTRLSS